MIDYDSFSHCNLMDIFFRFSRGSKRVKIRNSKDPILLKTEEISIMKWRKQYLTCYSNLCMPLYSSD